MFFIFTARLPKPDADGRKSCHYYFLSSFPSTSSPLSLLTSPWHHPPPSPPSLPPPPSFPLGNKLNLTNDLFCLACLLLAMFSKWSNGNLSLVSVRWQNGRLCWGQANRAGLVWKEGGEWYWTRQHAVNQPELESRGFQGWAAMKALKRVFYFPIK